MGLLSNKIWVRIFLGHPVIGLQATSFTSFSYEQKRNVLDAGWPTPDLKLVAG